jgi:hypothetical protein
MFYVLCFDNKVRGSEQRGLLYIARSGSERMLRRCHSPLGLAQVSVLSPVFFILFFGKTSDLENFIFFVQNKKIFKF